MPADWRARAQEPDDALRCVHSGMTLFVHGAAATPTPLLEALVRRTDLADVTLFHMHTEGPAPFAAPEHQHRFPFIEFHPCDRTNDTSIIRRNDRVVAINSALEVDLSGQVCADSVGFRIYSGIGGQMDFIRGAALSDGGQPIIALPSTAAGGAVSRIVPALTRGSGVVTTRGHVHWVVTEYGAVNIFGKSLRQRAEALIGVAHPDVRADLRRAYADARSVVLSGAQQ